VISSYDDYRIKKKEYGVLKVISMTKAVLNQSFDSTLDIFVLPIADGRILISDKLHISLKKKSFTGIEQKAVHTITHDALV
jgi:hypothetical protein